MLVLFQREGCPWCRPVRHLLTDLGISYLNVNVPKPRELRHDLIRTTGSSYIPALLDGDQVLSGRLESPHHVLTYLAERFDAKPERLQAALADLPEPVETADAPTDTDTDTDTDTGSAPGDKGHTPT